MSFARLARLAAVVAVVPMLLAAIAPVAVAKGQIEARLDRAIPKDAKPGSLVTVGWSLGVLEGSTWIALSPDGAFVRLIGNATGSVTEVAGRRTSDGHYTARIAIPAGGVATVWLGADARCVGPACVHTSDNLYPLAGIGGVPVVVPASELLLTIDPLPRLGPPYSSVDVTLRASLEPGVALGQRVLPGTFVVRAVDARTGLAAYETALPIGDGRYQATLQVSPGETLTIEAGTQAIDRVAIATVMTASPTTLMVPGVAAPAPAARAGSGPASGAASGTGTSAAGGSAPTTPQTAASEEASPSVLLLVVGGLIVLGLVLARGSRGRRAAV